MTYLPRRLRKPNNHPGRIVSVSIDRLAFTDDRLSHGRPRTEDLLGVWAEPAEHHGRSKSLIVWLAAVLALLCAIAWWAL